MKKLGWIDPNDIAVKEETFPNDYQLVKHEFKSVIRGTDAAILFRMLNKTNRALWIPRSQCFGMQINEYSGHITVYVPKFCNSKEINACQASA